VRLAVLVGCTCPAKREVTGSWPEQAPAPVNVIQGTAIATFTLAHQPPRTCSHLLNIDCYYSTVEIVPEIPLTRLQSRITSTSSDRRPVAHSAPLAGPATARYPTIQADLIDQTCAMETIRGLLWKPTPEEQVSAAQHASSVHL
jgi:hypothetical protein